MEASSLVVSLRKCQKALRRTIARQGARAAECKVHEAGTWRTISFRGRIVVFARAPYITSSLREFQQDQYIPLYPTSVN
jgi:hypothetical protein